MGKKPPRKEMTSIKYVAEKNNDIYTPTHFARALYTAAQSSFLLFRVLQELDVNIISQEECQSQWGYGKGRVEVSYLIVLVI